jgi:hypothetical protein
MPDATTRRRRSPPPEREEAAERRIGPSRRREISAPEVPEAPARAARALAIAPSDGALCRARAFCASLGGRARTILSYSDRWPR